MSDQSPNPNPNPNPDHSHDHNHESSSPTASFATPPAPTATCANCGGPTCRPSPPTPAPWSELSPPPAYRPIRAPAINAPTNTAAIILSPVPQPLPTPVLTPPYQFQTPNKQITNLDDIKRFNESPSGRHFLSFVAALSHSVHSRKLSDELPVPLSPVLDSLIAMLKTLSDWVDQIPPLPHQARYGNPAYRLWHERLNAEVSSLMKPVLSTAGLEEAEVELVPYLLDSFGNATRIDYGTGHETNFAAFLYCLACLNLIKEEDYPGVVTRVFITYLDLMRKLQLTYCLEPAGSHGVWGLDDYHFLPFIFGAAQLINHKYMKPKSIHNPDILENFSNEYMYLGCVSFVKKAKKGVFAEHSPMLDDISGVAQWSKVNSGLLKMYKAEVLEKVPIMQHFLFGSIIKWE